MKRHLKMEEIEIIARELRSAGAGAVSENTHLRSCRLCQTQLEEALDSRKILSALPATPQVPVSLRLNIEKYFQTSHVEEPFSLSKIWRNFWLKPALAWTTILLILAGLYILSPKREPENPFAVEWVFQEPDYVAQDSSSDSLSSEEKLKIMKDLESIANTDLEKVDVEDVESEEDA